MDSQAVATMLQRDRSEWEGLVALLEERRDQPLHEAGSPPWTSRDVYTHLAAMMEGSTAQMEAKLAGRPYASPWPAGLSEDEVNARIQREHGHLSHDEARDWAQRAFDRLAQTIEAVPIERWDKELEFYARADGSEHYAGHRQYILAQRR